MSGDFRQKVNFKRVLCLLLGHSGLNWWFSFAPLFCWSCLTLLGYPDVIIQSTLVISKSKGPSKTLRDIRTSTYQIYSIEEKMFEQPNFTNDCVI